MNKGRWLFLLFLTVASLSLGVAFGREYEVNPALLTLFGTNTNFRCHVDMRKHGESNAPPELVSFELARRGDKVRIDVDIESIRNGPFPEIVLEQLRGIGVKRVVGVVRFDRRQMSIYYPSLQAYVESPVTLIDSAQHRAKTGLRLVHGFETVKGHRCRHCTRQLPRDSRTVMNLDTWEATDMRGFPIRVMEIGPGSGLDFSLSNIRFGGVGLADFAVPPGYERYDSMEKLVLSKIIPFNLGR